MKKIIFLVALIMCELPLHSQTNYRHNIISLGIGPSFTGSGDDIGTGMFNESLISLNDRISINSRLYFYLFNSVRSYSGTIPDYYSQQTGMSLDLGLNVSPLKTGKRYLYLMGGGCLRYFANSDVFADIRSTRSSNDGGNEIESEAIEYREYRYDKGVSPGYYFGLGFTENISTHITYGLKCNFQFYFDEGSMSDVIWLMGINIGYDFH